MTQNIISVLLFLLPGVVAMYVEENISGSSSKPKSDLERTVEGIILSAPVFIITLSLIEVANLIWVDFWGGQWWGLMSIRDMEQWLNPLKHLGLYLICSIVSAIIIGILWSIQSKKMILVKFFNFIRGKMGKANLSGYISVWDEIVNNQEEVVVSLKTKDGQEIKGFLRGFSQSSDKPREITLDGFEVVEKFEEYLNKPILTYHNLETGTFLTLYDMSLCNDYARTISHPSVAAAAEHLTG